MKRIGRNLALISAVITEDEGGFIMLKMNLQLFAETAGFVNQVWALTGTTEMAAGTGALIKGVESSSFARMCDILEITAFGDTHKKRMAGLKDTEISISGTIYVGDTTGQDILVPGDSIFIGVMPQGVAVAGTQVAAIVESFATKTDVSGKQTFDAKFSCIAAPVVLPIRS